MSSKLFTVPSTLLLAVVLLLTGGAFSSGGTKARAAPRQAIAPLSAAWRGASSAALDGPVPATNPALTDGDAGIPGFWRVQRFGTPLDVIFVDPTHGWSRDATQRTTDGGQTWTWAHAPGTSIAAFVSPTEGWAGGDYWSDDECHEYIDHTTDGGSSWSRQYTSRGITNPCYLDALYFVDNLYGWGFARPSLGPSRQVKTTDGGSTWQPADIEVGQWLKMQDRTTWFRLTPDTSSPYCYPYGQTDKLSKTTDAGATWVAVGNLPSWTGSGPYIAPDGRFMVVVGGAGHIARSTDGGATWVDVPSPFTDHLSWVAFANSAVGWAAGAGGTVLRTGDAGLTWTRQQTNTTHDVTWMIVFNLNDALLSAGQLYRTSDGGAHWQPLPYVSNGAVADFAALSADAVWAASRKLLATTDGGSDWQELNIAATAVDAVDPGYVWALGSQLWRTTDGGGHWTAHQSPPGSRDLDFADPMQGWVIGKTADIYRRQAIYATTDGGISWQMQELPGDPTAYWPDFNQVVFVDSQHGWVAGDDVLLRTTNGGASWERIGGPSGLHTYCRLSFITDREGWEACTDVRLQDPVNRCTYVGHTTDGGDSWSRVAQDCGWYGTYPFYRDVSFQDANEGWAVRDNGWIERTIDGGMTWQKMQHPSGLSLGAVVAATPG